MARRGSQLLVALITTFAAGAVRDATAREIGESTLAIVGGAPSEAPEVFALVDDEGPYCTAFAIAPRVALTAAHCVTTPARPELPLVADGAWRSGVERVEVHPGYDPFTYEHDVALLLLDTDRAPAHFDLGESGGAIETGSLVAIIGFGATEAFTTSTSTVERRVEARVEAVSIEAYDLGESACNGDSGGPIVAGRGGGARAVGIVSTVSFGCRSARAIRLDGEAAWIDDAAARLLEEEPGSCAVCTAPRAPASSGLLLPIVVALVMGIRLASRTLTRHSHGGKP